MAGETKNGKLSSVLFVFNSCLLYVFGEETRAVLTRLMMPGSFCTDDCGNF
jgi:hypothetical protein